MCLSYYSKVSCDVTWSHWSVQCNNFHALRGVLIHYSLWCRTNFIRYTTSIILYIFWLPFIQILPNIFLIYLFNLFIHVFIIIIIYYYHYYSCSVLLRLRRQVASSFVCNGSQLLRNMILWYAHYRLMHRVCCTR